MLRDLSQALLKFKSKAKPGDQPTGWLKQFWNGDDEQGDGIEASDLEASESRPAASGNCPRTSESGPEASENRPAASDPEATEETLPMQSRASSKSSETFSDGKMVRYCSQSRMAYRWEPGTNDKDWCQRMSKPSTGNEIIAVWPDGKFWRVPGMTVSMYYNTKPELPPLAKSAPSVKDNNANMLWTGQDKNGGSVQVKYVRCVERKTSTNKSWVVMWHAAAKAENSDKKPKPVQVASIATTTYSKDQIEKVEVFMKELGMDFSKSLCDKKSLDEKKKQFVTELGKTMKRPAEASSESKSGSKKTKTAKSDVEEPETGEEHESADESEAEELDDEVADDSEVGGTRAATPSLSKFMPHDSMFF